MSSHHPDDNLNALGAAAGEAIRLQQDKAHTLASSTSEASKTKPVLMAVLLIAFAGLAWLQYPRIEAPFGTLDPAQDQGVAEADLALVGGLVETYRASQGSYPDSLDQVRLPDGLSEFVTAQKIAYRKTDKAFFLEWPLPRWRVVMDGANGNVTFDVTARSGS